MTTSSTETQAMTSKWKWVPVDATREMIDAAEKVEEDGFDAMHKAMCAAAPQPDTVEPMAFAVRCRGARKQKLYTKQKAHLMPAFERNGFEVIPLCPCSPAKSDTVAVDERAQFEEAFSVDEKYHDIIPLDLFQFDPRNNCYKGSTDDEDLCLWNGRWEGWQKARALLNQEKTDVE